LLVEAAIVEEQRRTRASAVPLDQAEQDEVVAAVERAKPAAGEVADGARQQREPVVTGRRRGCSGRPVTGSARRTP
jgi:hypothetical protein